MSYAVKDSGSRRQFETGAVRDMEGGKGRMDLLQFHTLMELGKHLEAGALKYGDENWRKGMPTRVFFDSALRHMFKFGLGMKDERHDLAALWNLACLVETRHMIDRGILPASLENMPDFYNRLCPADKEGIIRCPTGCDRSGCAMDSIDPRQMQEDILRFGVLPPAEHNDLQARVNAAYEAEYTKGHAEETAARFAAGLPYADGSRLENVGEPNEHGQYAVRYISDERLDELQAGFDASSWNAPDDFSDLALKPDPNVEPPAHPKLDPNAPPAEAFDGENKGRDPVQYDDNFNLWDVWNETWTDTIGSFRDEDEARKALASYIESLEAEDDGPLPTATEIKAEVDERAASFIRDNPLFKVGVLDGDDGAEAACAGGCKVEVYAKEENPVDLFPWVIVALADASDKRRWRVQNNTTYFTDGTPGNVWWESSVMNADRIRDHLTAGTMRVTQAGGAEGAD